MIVNPKQVLQAGYIKEDSDCSPVTEKQIQQAGIDVRLKKVYTVHYPLVRISEGTKPDFRSIYRELTPDPQGFVMLDVGYAYSVDCMEYIKVPINMSAFVLHRSTFNRVGIFITGSVYDPGFEGNIGATMYVHNKVEVQVGTRIAQVLFMETSAASSYQGSYQKQKSHIKDGYGNEN